VAIEPRATLACPLIAAVDRWMLEDVQPAAHAWFGEPVVEIRQLSSYACRPINGRAGARISEHAFGNALDIAVFRLASGREVAVKTGWRGRPEERGFLRQIHAAACERFTTVLGPGADAFHYDHFHLDLARRHSGSVCKPVPQEVVAPPRPDPESMRMARPPSPIFPPARPYAARPPAPQPGPDPLFANRPLANLPPPGLEPPHAPSMGAREPVRGLAPAPASGDPIDLTPPRPTQVPAQAPGYAPGYWQRGVRPPGAIPTAGGLDPLVTGSINGRRYYRDDEALERALPPATPGEDGED
jgi:hypothetical protein